MAQKAYQWRKIWEWVMEEPEMAHFHNINKMTLPGVIILDEIPNPFGELLAAKLLDEKGKLGKGEILKAASDLFFGAEQVAGGTSFAACIPAREEIIAAGAHDLLRD